jgi:hypothetical protein
MSLLWVIVVYAYVIGTLGVVLYALAQMFGVGQGRHQH